MLTLLGPGSSSHIQFRDRGVDVGLVLKDSSRFQCQRSDLSGTSNDLESSRMKGQKAAGTRVHQGRFICGFRDSRADDLALRCFCPNLLEVQFLIFVSGGTTHHQHLQHQSIFFQKPYSQCSFPFSPLSLDPSSRDPLGLPCFLDPPGEAPLLPRVWKRRHLSSPLSIGCECL